jgi:hypothetical protein
MNEHQMTLLGLPLVLDIHVPPDEVRLRDNHGRTVSITGVEMPLLHGVEPSKDFSRIRKAIREMQALTDRAQAISVEINPVNLPRGGRAPLHLDPPPAYDALPVKAGATLLIICPPKGEYFSKDHVEYLTERLQSVLASPFIVVRVPVRVQHVCDATPPQKDTP